MLANLGQRSFPNAFARWVLKRTTNVKAREVLHGSIDVALAGQHLSLAEIQMLGLLSKSKLLRMIKFCVVRNPYDRMISTLRNIEPNLVLEPKVIEAAIEKWDGLDTEDHNLLAHFRPQSHFLKSVDDDICIDIILRHETLESDFAALCKRIGADSVALPWIGKSKRRGYRDLLSDRSQRLIEKHFHQDLDAFGYSF